MRSFASADHSGFFGPLIPSPIRASSPAPSLRSEARDGSKPHFGQAFTPGGLIAEHFGQPFGSAFAVQARWPVERARIEGESRTFVKAGDSGNPATFHFCPACGSDVYYTIEGKFDNLVAVPLGAFNDPYFVKIEKLQMITKLTEAKNFETVLNELAEYTNDIDTEFGRTAMKSIGKICVRIDKAAEKYYSPFISLY